VGGREGGRAPATRGSAALTCHSVCHNGLRRLPSYDTDASREAVHHEERSCDPNEAAPPLTQFKVDPLRIAPVLDLIQEHHHLIEVNGSRVRVYDTDKGGDRGAARQLTRAL